ncbi:MAG: FAD-dependent monooxygenase [Bacteroidetes bacterium]|nr:FAD-dependent monooxygenase [Bacteroidota bacterium]HET6243302.1 NAD(P)/FAD-dependent oxidoreductase [Bacteroidia bacterium]
MAEKVTIIGAGLVGSLFSIYLARKGYHVDLFERRTDMRKEKISAGKSINLALSDRGWKALELIGVAEEVKKVAIPMHGRMVHDVKGELSFYPYGKDSQSIYSVSRGGLNSTLMNLAESHPNLSLYFNEKCIDVNLDSSEIIFENQASKNKVSVYGNKIIGADGAFSTARLALQMTDRFNYSQEYLEHGYKELTIPANTDGTWKIEKNALHIWPRGEYMLIALPNLDGSFTCTLFFPFEGENSFGTLKTAKDVSAFFEKVFPDAVSLMPTYVEDFENNPTSSLVMIKCNPWNYKDKLLLIGDASHGIVPFFGQGMNSGFEDCTVLAELFEKHGEDWEKVFNSFSAIRKPDTDAICQLALNNYIEMRDLVADPMFVLRKKIESRFHQKYPDKWVPLYSMVTFSDMPYSAALKEGSFQDNIMKKILSIKNIEQIWDSEEVEMEILKYF